MISIIIPVYQAQDYIERCLESIKNQNDNSDLEIVCVNDGSTDNSKKIIEDFKLKNKNIKVKIIDKENTGVSDSRNIGIENAEGKYIMFVDSDDELETNAIEELRKALSDNIDVIIYNSLQIKKNNKNKERIIFNEENGIIPVKKVYDELIRHAELNTVWQFLILKDFILENKIKFDNQYAVGEDLLFNSDMFTCNPQIYYLNKIIYRYNYNEKSVMRNLKQDSTQKRINQTLELYCKYYEYIKKWKMDSKENREYLSSKAINVLNYELRSIILLDISNKEKINMLKETFENPNMIEIRKNLSTDKYLIRESKYIYTNKIYLYFLIKSSIEIIRKILNV